MAEMADPKQFAILREGAAAWNRWRAENPGVVPQLRYADLREVRLQDANLNGADLSWANFRGADLTEAALSHCALREADLASVRMREADLSHADLRDADLRSSDLSRANLHGANLQGACLLWTTFADVDLSQAKGLETIEHMGPSSIGIDTIYRSKGQIPEVFLRGAGVPETFITYIRSLVGQPIEFYSCFISYSSKDDEFAQRLYADLQSKGVRCWFAPEDLKIGDRFRQRIDESIRIHDKLLLALSADSINSPWVESEVEAALERERREQRLVLFPIRLDDAVMGTTQAWGADLRRTRHLGDFTRWKDRDSYQTSFTRLLRDLSQSEKS